MAELVLGPIQRFADETRATIWVETDAPCTVSALGAAADTFTVHGHHYALVEIEGLDPGSRLEYSVALDDVRVWPPDDYGLPPPVVRTRRGPDTRIVFGSCRGAAPLEPPWTLGKGDDERGLGPDALAAYADRMIDAGTEEWPDLVLLLGDQVYADQASPHTREAIRRRRDISQPPWEEIADFEEYTLLYRESWSSPLVRWLLSTVPVAMIFDDHDIIDDWNISASWVADMREHDWWTDRIVGGLVSYWVYQHLGNLSPDHLADDGLYRTVREADDAGAELDAFARAADGDPRAAIWSFDRTLGDTRLVVVDSRAGRVLDERERDMLDDLEWRYLERLLDERPRRLVIGSSLPILMPNSVHDLERWNQRLAAGAWGPRMAHWAEDVRREYDLEHWSAFPRGFDRMMDLLGRTATRDGRPESVTLLSGDVHHGYIARLDLGDGHVPVHQVVASPLRQTVDPLLQRAYRIGIGPVGRWIGRTLARLAGAGGPDVSWERCAEPIFANHVATLDATDRGVFARIETAHQTRPTGPAELRPAVAMRLA